MTKGMFAVVFLSGGAIGIFAGYRLAEHRMRGEFEEALEIETTAMAKRFYAARQKYASPQEAVEALGTPTEAQEVLETYRTESREPVPYHKIKPSSVQHVEAEEEPKPEPIVEANIFETQSEPPRIYTITMLEYEHDKPEYIKNTLTWYVEDSILADFDDDPFDSNALDKVVGNCLERFGEKSDDPDVVFVRNDNINIDYAISREPGSYWRSVHGVEPADPRPSQSGG